MKIFNTLSRKKEVFKPLKKGEIKMYVCGPTVYDVGHLGHARAAVSFDLIRRYFLYKGFCVTFVSNITDVDDKIIKRAAEKGITEKELAQSIIPEYEKDYAALNVLPSDFRPLATQYIGHMVALVEKLLKKGIAYKTEDGIYFEVSRAKNYGKLSNQRLKDLQAGARIAVDEKKKASLDFALWKAAKQGEPSWPGPNGMEGRPGWHIECSAMSMDLLGETFDIHGGGIDLQFPHHECEIAQSEIATGKTFARYWMHNGHIKINNEKMSKSLGNFFTIKEILAAYHPSVVRYFLISTHYRMPIDFSNDLLEQAKNSLERLKDGFRNIYRFMQQKAEKPSNIGVAKKIGSIREEFISAMDDDFEISRSLAVAFEFINQINIWLQNRDINFEQAKIIVAFLREMDFVFGVIEDKEQAVSQDVEKLIGERNEARKNRNFARADQIRKELEKQGILLEDSASGTVWKKAL
ncbi:cysteine--tRNA ligase [Candidatus Peregrinibacteria bacterium]|nr:cysteine--tRNA ligase [Candidatus Peregrinibacteria bacterium]